MQQTTQGIHVFYTKTMHDNIYLRNLHRNDTAMAIVVLTNSPRSETQLSPLVQLRHFKLPAPRPTTSRDRRARRAGLDEDKLLLQKFQV
jgi:hypothetical protein